LKEVRVRFMRLLMMVENGVVLAPHTDLVEVMGVST